MTLEARAAFRSDVGMARERNEDACYAGAHLFIVADGLGGHRAGEVASSLAIETVSPLDQDEPKRAADSIASRVRKANRAVFEHAEEDPGLKGMGTTLTAIVVSDGRAHLAHVGDSRCYLIRRGQISQLSHDHTLVARLVTEGKLTPEQAASHPQRSILTRALGADRDVDVDEAEFPLQPGDRLVLCSDGLTGMLIDDEIMRLASEGSDLEEICDHLIDEANARGGPDNVTAVVVDISGTPTPAQVRRGRATPKKQKRSHRVPVRLFVWLALLAAVVIGGVIAIRTWTSNSFYVGLSGDRVAIFRGVPVEFAGLHFSHVEEQTQLRVRDVQTYYRPQLKEGITAKSLADARHIVEAQIPRASPSAKPTPKPTPSPTKAKKP